MYIFPLRFCSKNTRKEDITAAYCCRQTAAKSNRTHALMSVTDGCRLVRFGLCAREDFIFLCGEQQLTIE